VRFDEPLMTTEPINVFQLSKSEIQKVQDLDLEKIEEVNEEEQESGKQKASRRSALYQKLNAEAEEINLLAYDKLIVIVNFSIDVTNDATPSQQPVPDVMCGIGMKLSGDGKSAKYEYERLSLPINRKNTKKSGTTGVATHKKLNAFLRDLGYLNSCIKRNYMHRSDKQLFQQQFMCKHQLYCMK